MVLTHISRTLVIYNGCVASPFFVLLFTCNPLPTSTLTCFLQRFEPVISHNPPSDGRDSVSIIWNTYRTICKFTGLARSPHARPFVIPLARFCMFLILKTDIMDAKLRDCELNLAQDPPHAPKPQAFNKIMISLRKSMFLKSSRFPSRIVRDLMLRTQVLGPRLLRKCRLP